MQFKMPDFHFTMKAVKSNLKRNRLTSFFMVPRDRILIASGDRMRQRRTSCRHGDFQTKIQETQIRCIFFRHINFFLDISRRPV